MLCSACSKIVKPVVALDIDGTLGDYHTHFFDFAEQYLGMRLSRRYRGAGSFRQWFEMQGIKADQWHSVKLAYRQGGMKRSMPIFEGATDLVSTIAEAGAELWVTTTRPYLSLDTIVPDTVEWLDRHGIMYDGMLFDEDKYTQLVARVDPDRIVAIVDDLHEMCDAADLAVGRRVAILIGTEYNDAQHERRSYMPDIINNIGLMIDEWEIAHVSN